MAKIATLAVTIKRRGATSRAGWEAIAVLGLLDKGVLMFLTPDIDGFITMDCTHSRRFVQVHYKF
jgi:hypothetical protein